jgi:hypothetical protein
LNAFVGISLTTKLHLSVVENIGDISVVSEVTLMGCVLPVHVLSRGVIPVAAASGWAAVIFE